MKIMFHFDHLIPKLINGTNITTEEFIVQIYKTMVLQDDIHVYLAEIHQKKLKENIDKTVQYLADRKFVQEKSVLTIDDLIESLFRKYVVETPVLKLVSKYNIYELHKELIEHNQNLLNQHDGRGN